MKKYFYNYQAITRFSKPVDRHYFLLRCMPCVNACQQTGKRELFIHPGGSVIYGADAWKIRFNMAAGWKSMIRLCL